MDASRQLRDALKEANAQSNSKEVKKERGRGREGGREGEGGEGEREKELFKYSVYLYIMDTLGQDSVSVIQRCPLCGGYFIQ